MPDLIIRSNGRSDELVLTPDERDYWRATVTFDGLSATRRFYEPNMGELPAYFVTLAKAWRGWDGEQAWRSLEGDIRLAAAHDGLGSVGLTVQLRTVTDRVVPPGVERWRADGALVLDAGGLDDLARRAARLYSSAR